MLLAILLKHVSVKEQYRNFQSSKLLIESQNALGWTGPFSVIYCSPSTVCWDIFHFWWRETPERPKKYSSGSL